MSDELIVCINDVLGPTNVWTYEDLAEYADSNVADPHIIEYLDICLRVNDGKEITSDERERILKRGEGEEQRRSEARKKRYTTFIKPKKLSKSN
jgi:hypothetical protein